MLQRFIDLHLHSSASDGRYPPARLIEMAHARGLSAVALTDHDTTAGLAEAARRAAELNLEFIPGIELEAAHPRGTLHILGYFIDPNSPALQSLAARAIESRTTRNEAILEKLAAEGLHLAMSDLTNDLPANAEPLTTGFNEQNGSHPAPSELSNLKSDIQSSMSQSPDRHIAKSPDRQIAKSIGRPHIAHALVRTHQVKDFRTAFTDYLADGAKCFVPLNLPTAETVLSAITTAHGLASLAHPVRLNCESSLELRTLAKRLREAGLRAIETIHPSHTPAQTVDYEKLAAELKLSATGGSDFHRLPPKQGHGIGFGRVKVPYELLIPLRRLHPFTCVSF
ncbi:MAG: PHP domain-containing protein [Planctomycetes bacterium]|nr:PHP domain-containing protein [Planctomycetota bacterium]